VKAVTNDPYTKGGSDFSATELVAPAQQVILKHRYFDQISIDVTDRIWALIGQCVHLVLERVDIKNALKEERIFAEILKKQLSGALDLYHEETLSDYKITTVWTAIKGNRTAEWTAQMNILAYLLGTVGFEVKRCQVVAIYRDWSEAERSRYGDRYPPKAECICLELWSKEKQLAFIEEKMAKLIEAEKLVDDELPICTDEEMWAKPDTYAVVKVGKVRATKVCMTADEAMKVKDGQKNPEDYEIKVRSGEHSRCEKYCDPHLFCSQYQSYKASTTSTGEEAP
jgi:hypothetical protein